MQGVGGACCEAGNRFVPGASRIALIGIREWDIPCADWYYRMKSQRCGWHTNKFFIGT
jgi:hypothetical protein